MKKIILIILTLVISYNAIPQIQNEKVSAQNLPKRVSKTPKMSIQVKFPNKEAVLKELEENLKEKDLESKSVSFARFLPFELDFKDLEKICDNNYCYKEIEVESKGANTLGFHFAKLELIEKAQLYIINDKEQYVQGPLTKETVNFSRNFLSGLLPGEKARFLLIEPHEHAGKSNIHIDQISHGILDFYGVQNHKFSNLEQGQNWGFEFSAPCNQNIKCQQHLTVESKAVALIIKKTIDENMNENISLAGTGSLINNGKQNSLPIMLIAAHIYNDYEFYEKDYAQFIFHYRSPQCSPNTEGPMTIYVQGAIPLGPGLGSTDLKLIQLKANPNHVYPNNPVSFLGWSIIDEYKPFIENIHHPLGDVQKYAKGTSPQFLDYSIGGFNYHYWEYNLTAGIYEAGSSGSPTFDHNKRIIGALTSKSGATPPFLAQVLI